MRKIVAGLLVGICVGGAAHRAGASIITVNDASFETPGSGLDGGGHWAAVDAVWNPVAGQSQYQQNKVDNITAEDGVFSLWVPNTNGISQSLVTNVNVGDQLQITFWGGNGSHPEFGTSGGGLVTASFVVGATPYSDTFDTSAAPSGGWKEFTLTKTITNGGNLSLSFSSSSNPWLDNISAVTVTAAPEPGSLGVIGGIGLGLIRRRRRSM